jgi:methyl-accepting chemotaxis protein
MFAKFNDLAIARKLALSFGCIVAVTLLVSGFLVYETIALRMSVAANSRAVASLDALQTYKDGIAASQRAMSSLITSGDIGYAKAFEASLPVVAEGGEALADLAAQDKTGEATRQAEALAASFETWRTTIAQRQLGYLQDPYTVDIARFLEGSEDNANLRREMDAAITTLQDIYAAEQKKRSASQAADVTAMQIAAGVSGVLLLGMSIFLAGFLTRLIARPLVSLAEITNKLRDRQWDVEIGSGGRKDEIGDMLNALEVFRRNGIETERMENAQRLESAAKLKRAQEIEASIAAFTAKSASLLRNMSQASDRMAGASDQLYSVSGQSAEFTENVSRAAGSTGASVQSVASAVEEMSASIMEITQQVQNVSRLSQGTAEASGEATNRVLGLKASAERINNVIDIITGITGQINLLALNATIESARAGEAGRGFAVVAAEVKALASQAASATEQITTVIGAIQTDIERVVDTIGDIARSISAVNENTSSVAAAVEEQSAATNEISTNIMHVSSETTRVVDNVGSVHGKVEETRHVASEVRDLSTALKGAANELNGAIASFIADVAA